MPGPDYTLAPVVLGEPTALAAGLSWDVSFQNARRKRVRLAQFEVSMFKDFRAFPRGSGSLALALLFLLACGCQGGVKRRLTVRSDPPGALVYVDNKEIGHTPASVEFAYYGTREIRLEKDGFETITVKQKFRPPWYELPVVEFFSENLWPREIRDERVLDFQLFAQRLDDGRLRERGEALRGNSRQGFATPLPDVAPRGAVPPGSAPLPQPVQPLPQPRRPSGVQPPVDPSAGPVFGR